MSERKSWCHDQAAVICEVDGRQILAVPKVFKSGSCGWYSSNKVGIADELCQVTITCVVVGSRSWPDHDAKGTVNGEQKPTTSQTVQDAPQSLPAPNRPGKPPGKKKPA